MIRFHKENDEVLYPEENIVSLKKIDMDELKNMALQNPRQRIRMCAHRTPNDHLHEMFIIHTSGCYVRPHKHIGKAESMSILEGEVDVVLFHDNGDVLKVLEMGDPATGKPFYYRLSEPIYHTLLIKTPFLVFHEITEGPFLREKTEFPEWAPEEQSNECAPFIRQLELSLQSYK